LRQRWPKSFFFVLKFADAYFQRRREGEVRREGERGEQGGREKKNNLFQFSACLIETVTL
jgi:hypothetical protein